VVLSLYGAVAFYARGPSRQNSLTLTRSCHTSLLPSFPALFYTVLLEAPEQPGSSSTLKNKVLLTIDLTTSVANEAIEKKCSVVVAYRKW